MACADEPRSLPRDTRLPAPSAAISTLPRFPSPISCPVHPPIPCRVISCCRMLHARQHDWRFKSLLKGAARPASVYTDFAFVHAGGRPAVGSSGATSVATDMAMGRPSLHNDFRPEFPAPPLYRILQWCYTVQESVSLITFWVLGCRITIPALPSSCNAACSCCTVIILAHTLADGAPCALHSLGVMMRISALHPTPDLHSSRLW